MNTGKCKNMFCPSTDMLTQKWSESPETRKHAPPAEKNTPVDSYEFISLRRFHLRSTLLPEAPTSWLGPGRPSAALPASSNRQRWPPGSRSLDNGLPGRNINIGCTRVILRTVQAKGHAYEHLAMVGYMYARTSTHTCIYI